MSATDRKPDPPASGYTQEDWDAVSSPELTEQELARLRPASEMPREVFEALPKNRGGRPKSDARKVPVTIRVDPDVLEAYRATGAGWQARMHEAIACGAPGNATTSRQS